MSMKTYPPKQENISLEPRVTSMLRLLGQTLKKEAPIGEECMIARTTSADNCKEDNTCDMCSLEADAHLGSINSDTRKFIGSGEDCFA